METKKYPRYLFDVDFDALPKTPEPDEAELATKAPPTFSEEELARAREQAREEGRLEGLAQSNAGFEHRIAELLALIEQRFSHLHAAQQATNEVIARSAVRLAVGITEKLVPEFARQNGVAETEAFVRECLSRLFGEPEITIHVPEDAAAELEQRLPPIAKRHRLENGIRIVVDAELPPSDCRIDWSDGGAERNCGALLANVGTIVERFLEHSREQESAAETPPAADAADVSPGDDVSPGMDDASPDPGSTDDDGAATTPESAAEPDAGDTSLQSVQHEESKPAIPETRDETPAVDKSASIPSEFEPHESNVESPTAPMPVGDRVPSPGLPGAIAAEPARTGGPVLPGAVAPAEDSDKPSDSSESTDPAKT